MSCCELSAAAGEPLAGTASRADRLLLVEVRGAWGRDPLTDSGLPEVTVQRLAVWLADTPSSRVLFIRRPERRTGSIAVYRVDCVRAVATMLELDDLEELADAALDADAPDGIQVAGPLLLTCTHGRRDACCARVGVPVFDALRRAAPSAVDVWHSSHQGGHRFAGNVLVLPHGLQLGRVGPDEAADVARTLASGRIPLSHYRGRTIHDAAVQAADSAVRERLGLDGIDDVSFVGSRDGHLELIAAGRTVRVTVTERPGPSTPLSCGDESVATTTFEARIVGQSVR